MPSTPQSQARSRLRAVAREGAHYIADLPLYDDEYHRPGARHAIT
nr:MAG TPA: hypothetical protein [Caudoviricetes sp.]